MKQKTEGQCKATMAFFTPELYLQFNSENDEEADRALKAWEVAVEDYHSHLASIRPEMPPDVQVLARSCYHDWIYVGSSEGSEPMPLRETSIRPLPAPAPMYALSIRNKRELVVLTYALGGRVCRIPPPESWPFSGQYSHWLYDEIEKVEGEEALFRHRILFSDGTIVDVPFSNVLTCNIPMRSHEGTIELHAA